jgi:hypothetical protein
LAQTTLRSVLGEVMLDDLLSKRETLNVRLQSILDNHTDPWGIKVALVEVKQVELPLLSALDRETVASVPRGSLVLRRLFGGVRNLRSRHHGHSH